MKEENQIDLIQQHKDRSITSNELYTGAKDSLRAAIGEGLENLLSNANIHIPNNLALPDFTEEVLIRTGSQKNMQGLLGVLESIETDPINQYVLRAIDVTQGPHSPLL